MATKAALKKWMDIIVERLNDIGPFVCKDWGGSVQFIFPDIKAAWILRMKKDGSVESLVEKLDEASASGTVETDSDTFIGIYEKRIGPSEAMASGKMKARGSLEALMKVLAPTVE